MTLTVREIAAIAEGRVVGDEAVEISGIAAVTSATAHDLVFVEDRKFLPDALASGAGAILAGAFAHGAVAGAPLVICAQPRLAFARAARRLYAVPSASGLDVHPTAVIDRTASVGLDVRIGAHAVVDEGAVLGDRVVLDPGVHVGRGVRVGPDSILRSNVVVYPGTTIGARVVAHAGTVLGSDGFGYVRDAGSGHHEAFPQVGRLVIEDDVELGALCTVDRGALGTTIIRRGTKLDNQVHVAHNVEVGEDVVMAAQSGIAGSTVVEDGVIVAGQAGIADHARVGRGVILGAQCGVTTGKVVRGPGVVFLGTPARPLKQYLKQLALLARLARK